MTLKCKMYKIILAFITFSLHFAQNLFLINGIIFYFFGVHVVYHSRSSIWDDIYKHLIDALKQIPAFSRRAISLECYEGRD